MLPPTNVAEGIKAPKPKKKESTLSPPGRHGLSFKPYTGTVSKPFIF
jgi:hypothetical protein